MEKENSLEIPENIDEMFTNAVEIVHNLPKKGPVSASYEQMASFYSLYKQATLGPCNISQPPFWNPIEKFKWNAWNSLGNMDQKKAKYLYLTKIQQKIDEVMQNYDVTEWMGGDSEKLETFLRPKFKIIGRELNPKPQRAHAHSHEKKETEPAPEKLSHKTGIDEVYSDDEYDDAIDAPILHNNPLSNHISVPDSSAGMQSFISYFETHVNNLTQQVKTLSNALTEQNKMVTHFMKEMTRLRREGGVGGLSWWMFAFFLLWPFIAQHVIRLIVRRLQIIL